MTRLGLRVRGLIPTPHPPQLQCRLRIMPPGGLRLTPYLHPCPSWNACSKMMAAVVVAAADTGATSTPIKMHLSEQTSSLTTITHEEPAVPRGDAVFRLEPDTHTQPQQAIGKHKPGNLVPQPDRINDRINRHCAHPVHHSAGDARAGPFPWDPPCCCLHH